jgi:hypothetical protein
MPLQWDQLRILLGHWVQFHPVFARIAGGALPGLMLSALYGWDGKGRRADGFIYKSQREWEDETSMTRGETRRAREALLEKGLIEAKTMGLPRTWNYRIRRDAVLGAIEVLISSVDSKAELAETVQTGPRCEKPSLRHGGKLARSGSTSLLDEVARASSNGAGQLNKDSPSNTPTTTTDKVVELGLQQSAQVALLLEAGMRYRAASRLPQRPVVYVKQMISLLRNGKIKMAGLYSAIRDGDWTPDHGLAHDTWSADVSYQRAWQGLSQEARLAGLEAALAKFPGEGQRAHIRAVLAQIAKPRTWLIDEVIRHSRTTPSQETAEKHSEVVAPLV